MEAAPEASAQAGRRPNGPQGGRDYPRTRAEFDRWFASEKTCAVTPSTSIAPGLKVPLFSVVGKWVMSLLTYDVISPILSA